MSKPRTERRLAAILAADVAGYSRPMGEEEEAEFDFTGGNKMPYNMAYLKKTCRIFLSVTSRPPTRNVLTRVGQA